MKTIVPMTDLDAVAQTAPNELVEMLPVEGRDPVALPRVFLDIITACIVEGLPLRADGPTGTGKTSAAEAFGFEPENLRGMCSVLGFPFKPLAYKAVEVCEFESASEWFSTPIIRDGTSSSVLSRPLQILYEFEKLKGTHYCVLDLVELQRGYGQSLNGVLTMLGGPQINIGGYDPIDVSHVSFWTSSNLRAAQDGTYQHAGLAERDEAVLRRFVVNLAFGFSDAESEVAVVSRWFEPRADAPVLNTYEPTPPPPRGDMTEFVRDMVAIGQAVRAARMEGRLTSIVPPGFGAYKATLKLANALPHVPLDTLARHCLLGNPSLEDEQAADALIRQVLRGEGAAADASEVGGGLI